MRMRKKRHGEERIFACNDLLIKSREDVEALKAAKTFPVYLEIGAGKGDFAVAFSECNKDRLYIAVEKVSDVALSLLEKAKSRGCDNLRVIIGDAKSLPEFFVKGEISRIFLNFSDPWPKEGYKKRRLTHPVFLEEYKSLLTDDGSVFMKTDNRQLFDFSLEQFAAEGFHLENVCYDLHSDERLNSVNIQTEYERNFSAKGFTINYLEAYL